MEVVLALLTWHVATVRPGTGIDFSWQVVLAFAAQHGLVFGRDVVFTYGPLGFLSVPLIVSPPLTAAAFLFAAFVQRSAVEVTAQPPGVFAGTSLTAPLVGAFAGTRLVGVARPSEARADVAAALESAAAEESGHSLFVRVTGHVRLRVFALGAAARPR